MVEKDLIIIGSGPAGLRAAEEAENLKIDYLILEKGDLADAWRKIRPNMPMLSPNHPQRDWTSISNDFPIWKLDVQRPYCSAEEFVFYLDEYQKHFNLNIDLHTTVEEVQQNHDQHFEITTDKDTFRSRVLLNTTGFFGNPYIPNIPGLRGNPIVSHSHDYQTDEPFRGGRVVVIGAGNSGAELAIELVGHCQVYLITRGKLEFFSKTKNLCDIRGISESILLELIAMELIRHIPYADIKKLEENRLYFNDQILEVQHIVCATGYRPVLQHMSRIPVQIDDTTRFPVVTQTGAARDIKNLYFAGPLGYTGLGSLFIHGFIREIPAIINEINTVLNAKAGVSVNTV